MPHEQIELPANPGCQQGFLLARGQASESTNREMAWMVFLRLDGAVQRALWLNVECGCTLSV